MKKFMNYYVFLLILLLALVQCKKESAAEKVYVPPGEHDEVYAFLSGGYSGNVTVHGIPSGRLIKTIPVFSVFPENGYGFELETKELLRTTNGYVKWDDAHHPDFSMKDGMPDGRWMFINGLNTPRIARIDLKYFETKEIIEIPNSAGNHASSFLTSNSEYIVAATRFSIPYPNTDVAIEDASKGAFSGMITLVKVNPDSGKMNIDLQMVVPGFDYDLANCGRKVSKDWCFFSTYNTEQAWKMKEIESSKHDKDFTLALNWKKTVACKSKSKKVSGKHYHNYHPTNNIATSKVIKQVNVLDPNDCPGVAYYIPTPKSPHGIDVTPDGEYIVGGGKLSAQMPVYSFSKFTKAIKDSKNISKTIKGIPVLTYESTLKGEVQKKEKAEGKDYLCLGPLHTQFDNKGRAYTSCFLSNNVMIWEVDSLDIIEAVPSWYNIGHLVVVGGHTTKPYGKYLLTLNKLTQDRYLPTGMEMAHSAQLYDISGNKAQLLLDMPTMGEPHYGQMLPASVIKDKSAKFFKLKDNKHPYATLYEKDARIERKGNETHVYMTAQLTHFKPDKIELKVGETTYFHVTNITQKFDTPHGFAVGGTTFPNVLIMPGQTKTVSWTPKKAGIFPFYCTDFCSALHQEMQNYIRVSK